MFWSDIRHWQHGPPHQRAATAVSHAYCTASTAPCTTSALLAAMAATILSASPLPHDQRNMLVIPQEARAFFSNVQFTSQANKASLSMQRSPSLSTYWPKKHSHMGHSCMVPRRWADGSLKELPSVLPWVFDHSSKCKEIGEGLLSLKQGSLRIGEFDLSFCILAAGSGWNEPTFKATYHQWLNTLSWLAGTTKPSSTSLSTLTVISISCLGIEEESKPQPPGPRNPPHRTHATRLEQVYPCGMSKASEEEILLLLCQPRVSSSTLLF